MSGLKGAIIGFVGGLVVLYGVSRVFSGAPPTVSVDRGPVTIREGSIEITAASGWFNKQDADGNVWSQVESPDEPTFAPTGMTFRLIAADGDPACTATVPQAFEQVDLAYAVAGVKAPTNHVVFTLANGWLIVTGKDASLRWVHPDRPNEIELPNQAEGPVTIEGLSFSVGAGRTINCGLRAGARKDFRFEIAFTVSAG